MHRVSGPYRGYFVAAFTVDTNDGFVGYGRACASRPCAGWQADGQGDIISSAYPTELQALVAAEHKVRMEVDHMPPSWEPFTAPGPLVDSR